MLSILTSIGLDHTDILGTTYLDIAKDKAAIIKPHIPIVCCKNDDALKYVRDYALEQNAKPIELIGRLPLSPKMMSSHIGIKIMN